MKKTLLILSISILNTISFSQTFITNQKTFGGDNREYSKEIQQLSNGTFVACGSSKSEISGSKTTPNYGESDGWIVNFNPDYSINWELNIGGTENDYFSSILPLNDGSFLCGGHSSSEVNGNKTAPNHGSSDYWLFKISNTGTVLWEKTFGGSENDFFHSIAKLGNGFVLCGSSGSPISSDKSEFCRGVTDYWIVYVDNDGTIIWDKTVGGNSIDEAYEVVVNNGSIYISGNSSSNVSYEKTVNCYGFSDIWVVKLDFNGNIIWNKTIGGLTSDVAKDVLISNNEIYVCGFSDSNSSGNKISPSNGQYDVWLVKLDTNGVILWDKSYGGSSTDLGYSITELSSNRILIAGDSQSNNSGDVSEYGNGGNDLWFFSINREGHLLEEKKIGGNSYDRITSVIQLSNSNLLLLGTSGSGISGDKIDGSYGDYDFWLVEVSSTMDIVTNESTSNAYVFPNPNNGVFTISGLVNNSTISIYNLQGQLINVFNTTTESEIKINDSNALEKGIYLVSIKNDSETTILKYVVN